MEKIEGIDSRIAAQIQRQIFGEVLGRVSAGEKGKFFDGDLLHLPFSVTLRELADIDNEALEEIVAPSILKLIKAPLPAEGKKIESEDTVALGGWCALFTGDYDLIKRGIVPDSETGEGKKLEDVGQLTAWLESAVRIDQIVEAIYPLNVNSHAGIDETRLWSTKIVRDLTANNVLPPDQLGDSSVEQVVTAIERANATRRQCTERFLRFVTGDKRTTIRAFSDQAVLPELTRLRDELFDLSGVRQFEVDKQSREELEADGLLWAQYTGPYFDMLKKKGVIPRKMRSAIFSEPVHHATPNLPKDEQKRKATMAFFDTVFKNDGGNVFFWHGPGNINEQVGQLAMIPCFGIRGPINPATNLPWRSRDQQLITSSKGSRQHCTISDVPNVKNWESFHWNFKTRISDTPPRLADNSIFVWSANLLTAFSEPTSKMMELCNIFESDPDSERAKLRIMDIQLDLKEQIKLALARTFNEDTTT